MSNANTSITLGCGRVHGTGFNCSKHHHKWKSHKHRRTAFKYTFQNNRNTKGIKEFLSVSTGDEEQVSAKTE